MTEQYGQPNINNPRLTRSFAASAVPTLVQLNFDDQFVVADSTDGLIGFTLPLASQFPTWELIIKATNAGSTGNSVFVDTLAGETIDGAAFVLLTTDQEALFLKSDGSNWRVVNGSASVASTNVSLDIMYDSTAAASVAPILFVTWPEVVAAVAAIPGNAFATYQKTKYRLNVQTLSTIDPGSYNLANAEFRSAIKSSPNGTGAFVFGSGSFLIDDVAQLNGISVFGVSFGPTFTWSTFNFVEMIDCVFFQTLNSVGPPPVEFPGSFTVLRCYGSSSFGAFAISVGSGGLGDTLVIDAYDRLAVASSAFSGGAVDINILGGECDISFSQFGVSPFNINIGGGNTSNGEVFTNGENLLFSSGGTIDFSTTDEQELYAGGTNPPGSAPQTPALASPTRGFTAAKDGYLRGISLTLPTNFSTPTNSITIRVYVGGILQLTEPFETFSTAQFSDGTFGQYSAGDLIQVTIATDLVTGPPAMLDDGVVVSLRSA